MEKSLFLFVFCTKNQSKTAVLYRKRDVDECFVHLLHVAFIAYLPL